MSQPVVSRKHYAFVWLGLMALAVATTLIGYLDLGPFNTVIAVAIALAKALLIIGFFMHAIFEGKVVKIVLAGGVIWFLILVTMTLGDYASRGWLPLPGK